ncbi:hypothetical protein FHR59_001863 [Xanthomonas arboricola]|nr:hypothetical protein [Xanthomonas arboricola]MBB5675185.1 hypothetical protein [Xanthomonas arboricola]MBB6337653.1 hypothetical protein [Xanthomonas arboricola]
MLGGVPINVVTPDPDADPLAQEITIIWNPINDAGTVALQVEDRGTASACCGANRRPDRADLRHPLSRRGPGGGLEGWKLQALIKAVT